LRLLSVAQYLSCWRLRYQIDQCLTDAKPGNDTSTSQPTPRVDAPGIQ